MSSSPDLLADALLVQRMVALSDRAALLELDARHGMTLYALAYGRLFDGEASDESGAAHSSVKVALVRLHAATAAAPRVTRRSSRRFITPPRSRMAGR